MAQRGLAYDCDACLERDLGATRVLVYAPTVPGALQRLHGEGTHSEDDWEAVHLCVDCANRELSEFVQRLETGKAQAWIANVRAGRATQLFVAARNAMALGEA